MQRCGNPKAYHQKFYRHENQSLSLFSWSTPKRKIFQRLLMNFIFAPCKYYFNVVFVMYKKVEKKKRELYVFYSSPSVLVNCDSRQDFVNFR
jgi:hypothetical protein